MVIMTLLNSDFENAVLYISISVLVLGVIICCFRLIYRITHDVDREEETPAAPPSTINSVTTHDNNSRPQYPAVAGFLNAGNVNDPCSNPVYIEDSDDSSIIQPSQKPPGSGPPTYEEVMACEGRYQPGAPPSYSVATVLD